MAIQLSDHFSYGRLLRFTGPTMGTMVFLSIYVMVDGLFVSNFVGKTSLAAVNLIWPFITLFGVLGMMIGSGGSALVGKLIGQRKTARANQVFSMLIWVDLVAGLVFGTIAFIGVPFIAQMLGANGELLQEATVYGRIVAVSIPFTMLQDAFQSFLVVAERPKMGFVVIASAGVANIALDALFIIVFGWGIAGAAIATLIGEVSGGVVPLIYFLCNKTSLLQLRRARPVGHVLRATCFNGLSEFISNISMSLVGLLYNYQLMIYIGSDGVAAFGVTMDVSFVFMAIFLGYCIGSSPLVSFNYGARNKRELSNLFRKSIIILIAMGIAMTVLAELIAPLFARLFVGYDAELMELTVYGLSLYKWAFLVMGINLFGSAFFTALNNGLVSGLLSGTRTLVFECAAVMLLPMFFGTNGIWAAMPVAEFISLALVVFSLVYLHRFYGYTIRSINTQGATPENDAV